MKEIAVKYLLTDDDVTRLKNITEKNNIQGNQLPAEQHFENIMLCGSKYDIDKKFKYHEQILGLREG